MVQFPEGFVWGVATSAPQIEGAVDMDGRGPSIWDVFSRQPGRVWLGQTPTRACDHYFRFREDVAHMKRLGVQGYRLSLSWSRILPDGAGQVNHKGLDFYDRLVDALLEASITPYITLFHWDLPYELHCRGGWLNRESADWFGAYAERVSRRLSDRVSHWFTFNEPQIFVGLGYGKGTHAPGLQLPFHELLRMGHHILLAHGKGSQALRAASPAPCRIGLAPHAVVKIPATESPADVEAARRAMFEFKEKSCWSNTWWSDPVFFGAYPEDMLEVCGHEMPRIEEGDLECIHQPPDFYGVNLYAGSYVRAGADGEPVDVPWSPDIPLGAFKMVVTPEAMYWGAKAYYERYGKPILITENGVSCNDWVSEDGRVHDPQRIDFTTRYLRELHRAVEAGIQVDGYFHWSLMDNFEWAEGYKERTGLIYVNLETQERIWKDSAEWYRAVVKANGASFLDPDYVEGGTPTHVEEATS